MPVTPSTLSANDPWYLVHCKPKRELYAANTLKKLLGLDVFYPQSRQQSQGKFKYTAFFPGYIFVQADLQKVPLSHINTTVGVIRLVGFGGEPQPVPDVVIEIISEQLERATALSDHDFCPGDVVRMKRGPFQDLELVFLGSTSPGNRVYVLLNLLGRLNEVQIEAYALEKVTDALCTNSALPARRVRYTRGKGRKIKARM